MRKMMRAISLLLVLTMVLIPCNVFADNQTKSQSGNIVLVLDDTVSMQWNDPTKAAAQAAKSIGMLSTSDTSNIGVVTFCKDVMEKFGMVPLDEAAREQLNKFADTKITRKGEYTDIVVGMSEAMNMLNGLPDSDNTEAIIVVTDGENDFGAGRTEEISNTELSLVLKLAQETGVKIFLIGLNTEKEKVEDYMQNIADTTGGSVQFINSSVEVEGAIKTIYKRMGLIEQDEEKDLEVTAAGVDEPLNIPANVFEAVITLSHNKPLEIALEDPNGVALVENDTYVVTRSDTYTIIKLREPAEGVHILSMKNTEEGSQLVHMETFLNSEVMVDVTAPASAQVGEEIQIEATLTRGGEQYENDALHNLTAVAELSNGKTTLEENLPLSGNAFSGKVKLPEEGQWEITVTVRSDKNFVRSNDEPVLVDVGEGETQATQATQPTAPATPKDEDGMPFWLILVIVLGALILVAVAVLLLMKIGVIGGGVPKLEDVPRGSIHIVCKNSYALQWRTSLASRAIFSEKSARKKGKNLMQAIEESNAGLTRPVQMSAGCSELCKRITVKLAPQAQRRGQSGKRYELSLLCVNADGNTRTNKLNQTVIYNLPEEDLRIEISWS